MLAADNFVFFVGISSLIFPSNVNVFLLIKPASWCFDITMINKNIPQYEKKNIGICILYFLTLEFKGGFYFEFSLISD